MKIACVGKGGSGKSTLAALLIRHLQKQGRHVLAIDADLNMNLAGLLGVSFPAQKHLSRADNKTALRRHLRGNNPRITSDSNFAPTTPPGTGSQIIRTMWDDVLAPFSVDIDNAIRLMTVGTYEAEGIGQACYHTNLFPAENLLSHTSPRKNEVIVADMVAGTDAFSYSMHLQFDAIVLIAEPTPESAEVCALYQGLAQEAGVNELVHLIANKVSDEEDFDYIRKVTGQEPVGALPFMAQLKKARQRGDAISLDGEEEMYLSDLFDRLLERAAHPAIDASARYKKMLALHKKLSEQEWVSIYYGDTSAQIDPEFMPLQAA